MMLDEPPSLQRLLKLIPHRQLCAAYQYTTKRIPTLIPVLFLGLVLSLHSHEVYKVWKAQAEGSQNINQSERVSFVVGNYLTLDTLEPVAAEDDFSSIALAGENIGGQSTGEQPIEKKHVVQAGETLSQIASQYDLHSGSIALANPDLSDPEKIQVGQVLIIPAQDAPQDALDKESAAREQKKKVAAAAAAKKVASTLKSAKKTANVDVAASSSMSLRTPISYKYISQYFGRAHTGVDFVADVGTPVYAAEDGCLSLVATGYNGGYGNTVILNIGGGYTVRYAHLSRFASDADAGHCYSKGEVVAYSGNSGRSTGPHLHFEVRYNGAFQNPLKYVH